MILNWLCGTNNMIKSGEFIFPEIAYIHIAKTLSSIFVPQFIIEATIAAKYIENGVASFKGCMKVTILHADEIELELNVGKGPITINIVMAMNGNENIPNKQLTFQYMWDHKLVRWAVSFLYHFY